MENNAARLAEMIASLDGKDGSDDSRATSPGPGAAARGTMEDSKQVARIRPRTYPYFRYLPYELESEVKRKEDFNEMLKQLYISVEAGDFAGGAVYWTRELRNWLGLKFDPTKDQRVKLVRLYYELALAPGVDATAAERFSSMFMVLTK